MIMQFPSQPRMASDYLPGYGAPYFTSQRDKRGVRLLDGWQALQRAVGQQGARERIVRGVSNVSERPDLIEQHSRFGGFIAIERDLDEGRSIVALLPPVEQSFEEIGFVYVYVIGEDFDKRASIQLFVKQLQQVIASAM